MQDAEFIREVYYPNWLANVVMVKKANEKWRMCVDFTDLKKACSKRRLNSKTLAVKLYGDAFSGYNQIKLDEAD